jgi:hypothetical protein
MSLDSRSLLCICSSSSWLFADSARIEALIIGIVELLRTSPKAQGEKTSTSREEISFGSTTVAS